MDFMRVFFLILTFFSLISCVPQSNTGTSSKPFIRTVIETCEDSYIIFDAENNEYRCDEQCEQGQTAATDEEKQALQDDPSISDELKELLGSAGFVCVDEPVVEVRPTGQIFLNDDFCVCKNGQVASVNADQRCTSFCASKNDAAVATLYGDVSPGIDVVSNEKLKDLGGFCQNPLDNNAPASPACSLVISDGISDIEEIPLVTSVGSNSYQATIELAGVSFDTSYTFRIVETGSGVENASSGYEQFRLTDPSLILTPVTGDLSVSIINQYSCISRYDGIDNRIERYFYFAAGDAPPALPSGVAVNVFCHDYLKDGFNDNPAYKRLTQIAGHFALWNRQDSRFVDDDNDGFSIADQLVKQEVEKLGATISQKKYFSLFPLPYYPVVGANTQEPPFTIEEQISRNSGLALRPFIDQNGKSFCPDYNDYKGDSPELVALGRIIGTPTEGLYLGVGEAQTVTGDNISQIQRIEPNFLYIRENVLKKIWFHFGANNLPIKPTEETENQRTYFYWPPDFSNPYIKKEGYQDLYTVSSRNDFELIFQRQSDSLDETITETITHDRKFVCVPKVGE